MRGKWTHRIIKELRRLREEHRRGWIGRSEDSANRGQGYLSRVLSGEITHLDVELLFSIFEHAEVDIRDFLMRIGLELSAPTPGQYLERMLRKHEDRDPLLTQIDAYLEKLESENEVVAETESDHLRPRIKEIDDLRFSDDHQAEQHFRTLFVPAVPRIHPGLLAEALCHYAEILRLKGRLGIAARALKISLRFTEPQSSLHALVLQRLSHLFANQGWLVVAEEFARQAVEISVLCNELETIGKMLVTQGTIIRQQGDPYRCRYFLTSSVSYLPEQAWIDRAKAHEGLGWCAMEIGDLVEAQKHFDLAAKVHQTQSGIHWILILWQQSEIAIKQGDFETASQLARKMTENIPTRTPAIDQVLIMLQLSKILFLQQEFQELTAVARRMMQFLTPLQNDQMASAVIAEFIKTAQAGRMTFRILEQTRAKLIEIRSSQVPTPWW